MSDRKTKLLLAKDSTWVDHMHLPVHGLFTTRDMKIHSPMMTLQKGSCCAILEE